MLTTTRAHAAFTRLTCPTSGWGPGIPTEIGALEYMRQSTTPAGGATDMTLYNLDQTGDFWGLQGNGNIRYLQPWFGYFVTENNYDKVSVTVSGSNFIYTGALNPSTTSLVQSADTWDLRTDLGPVGRANIRWISDGSVATTTPPTIAQMTPRCNPTQNTTAPNANVLSVQTRMDGLLLGSGDTIYYRVTQPTNRVLVVSLDNLAGSAGADFDLYASTSVATPDDSNYQWRGFSGSASEALFIPNVTGNRTVYIGVHSFTGAGHFAITVGLPMINNPNFCATDSTLTGHVTLDSTQQAQLTSFFQAGSAHLYAYSNGMILRQFYYLNTAWSGSCTTSNGCDICVVADATGVSYGGGASGYPCGHVEMHGGNWTQGAALGWLFAHESGHACFGLPDEYQLPPLGDASPRYCGHTSMANSSKAQGFCSQAHCYDGQVFDTSKCDPGGQSNWALMLGSSWSTGYLGTRYSDSSLTALPTPTWNNPNLRALVSVFF